MKIRMNWHAQWNDFPMTCPVTDCGGKIRASLPDIQKGKTARCSRGHVVKLQDSDGSVSQVVRRIDNLGR